MTDFLNTTHRTVLWLKKSLDNDELTLKPPYQRNPVWSDLQKAALIDTILRGYPIPEIYMQDVVKGDGTEQHYVVDGQQRIRACLEYVAGEYTLDAKVSPGYGQLAFDDLDTDDRQTIYGYQFLVRLLPDILDEEIRSIFKRLNQNVVALNRQELRHSTFWGEFIKSMESLAEDDFWPESGVLSANDFRRMLDVEFVSELTVGYLHGPQNKKESLDKWYGLYEQEFPDRSRVEHVFRAVTGELAQAFPDMRRTRWRNKSDCYTLFLVMAAHADDLPLSSEGRSELRNRLIAFGEEVDAYVRVVRAGGQPKATKRVAQYAGAVQRAATDLANRRTRAEQVESHLAMVWDA